MKRSEKETFVEDFRERLGKAPVVYLTDFSGIDVKSMTVLRESLRAVGAEYVVVKNRLAKRALEGTDFPDLSEALVGPTGVVFGFEGAVEPARALSDFAKDHDDRPVFKLGVLENELLEPAQIVRLSKLPPREQLLAELAGAMESSMQALVGVLQAKLRETSGLFEALKDQKEQGA